MRAALPTLQFNVSLSRSPSEIRTQGTSSSHAQAAYPLHRYARLGGSDAAAGVEHAALGGITPLVSLMPRTNEILNSSVGHGERRVRCPPTAPESRCPYRRRSANAAP